MKNIYKILLVAALALVGLSIGAAAQAGGDNDIEDGDISSATNQAGSSSSGDAVGGQVVGVVSAGDASVDSTNRSEDVDVETGEAIANNTIGGTGAGAFTGQKNEGTGDNDVLDGDISSEANQSATATSGDGVGGAVIGVVTSAGGSADVVAANTSEDVAIVTGDAEAANLLDVTVGQVNEGSGDNDVEDGNIEFSGDQAATAASGDGVGGQVLGIVSAGDASVDATNESTDVDVATGDALANNFADTFVGQKNESANDNDLLDGDISSELAQDASANSGDAVAGQVAGVVTSAGGSADLVLANTSEAVGAESGESDFFNDSEEFVGQTAE